MAIEDNEIIDLYWQRNEQAIAETNRKYNRYLMKISRNILASQEDCEENVNDTYLKVWNRIPSEKPEIFSLFLAKISRSTAIDKWRRGHAKKRSGSEFELCLEEMEEVVSGQESVDEKMIAEELGQVINRWLKNLPKEKRVLFIGRYFYSDSIKEIGRYTGQKEASVKVSLHRMRQELKELLEKEGYQI